MLKKTIFLGVGLLFCSSKLIALTYTDCDQYAQYAVVDEQENFGYLSDEEYKEAYNFYKSSCEAGDALDPVFINKD